MSATGGRLGRDRGSAAVELAVTMPALLLALLLIVHIGLWQHARHVAQAAAREGARVARGYDGTAAAGRNRAEGYVGALAPRLLAGPTVTASRAATDATVRVRARVVSVLPWPRLVVDESSTGPVERFVPRR